MLSAPAASTSKKITIYAGKIRSPILASIDGSTAFPGQPTAETKGKKSKNPEMQKNKVSPWSPNVDRL